LFSTSLYTKIREPDGNWHLSYVAEISYENILLKSLGENVGHNYILFVNICKKNYVSLSDTCKTVTVAFPAYLKDPVQTFPFLSLNKWK
jgi:hypothetical protein